jgi:hypothetical protein
MKLFLRPRFPVVAYNSQTYHCEVHTETLVHSIIANEIRAFGSYEQNDSTVGQDFLDRFGLSHKGVNSVHQLGERYNRRGPLEPR